MNLKRYVNNGLTGNVLCHGLKLSSELDKKIAVNYSWRAKPAWEPTTTLIVASLIPDGKKLGLSQRGTVPTNNSVLTVCKNLRKLFKRLQDNLN